MFQNKILQQLKTCFKRANTWNRSQPTLHTRNRYLNYLIDSGFRRVNGLFVLLFENDEHRRSYKQYFLLSVEIEDWNIIIDGKNVFVQAVKNDLRTGKYSKDCNLSSRWLENWLFARL